MRLAQLRAVVRTALDERGSKEGQISVPYEAQASGVNELMTKWWARGRAEINFLFGPGSADTGEGLEVGSVNPAALVIGRDSGRSKMLHAVAMRWCVRHPRGAASCWMPTGQDWWRKWRLEQWCRGAVLRPEGLSKILAVWQT